ncbi:transposase [Pullulanibacillus sp. KACC 23026]|uniref:transposase n=1 Tax=Pullulanibacillus sp. KACC 23026 TaxID=3028315 RepID=UPI0023B1D7D0|nr:transposase [Pullulanibacillus sp. KACC 23026]WEG13511.1 transposase [Pullulanibacillus sp. KACC 23026]
MWRGVNRQAIFHDDQDRRKFLDILKTYKNKNDLNIYAWCLMSNHVHLLIKEGNEGISDTMKRIGISYVNYFNWKYQTTGSLFQDRFNSECVEERPYLLTVVRYIHQNPLKAGMVSRAEDWKWSSCSTYYGKVPYSVDLLDSELVLGCFSPHIAEAREAFRAFNESLNDDTCLDEKLVKKRLSDEEARTAILELIGIYEITQIKSLPKSEREKVL